MTRFKCRITGKVLGYLIPCDGTWEVHLTGKEPVLYPGWTREEAEDWAWKELEQ